MQTLSINISKADVINEVKMTSEYLGSRATGDNDPVAYERIRVIDANAEQLERFFVEACASATAALREWITQTPTVGSSYQANLKLSEAWDTALGASVIDAIKSYLVEVMLAKWLLIVSPDNSSTHATLASGHIAEAVAKLYKKVKPIRTDIDNG